MSEQKKHSDTCTQGRRGIAWDAGPVTTVGDELQWNGTCSCGERVYDVYHPDQDGPFSDDDEGTDAANARVIDAAHELLAACEATDAEHDHCSRGAFDEPEWLKAVRDAIERTKATG